MQRQQEKGLKGLKEEIILIFNKKERECLDRLNVNGKVDHMLVNDETAKRRGQHRFFKEYMLEFDNTYHDKMFEIDEKIYNLSKQMPRFDVHDRSLLKHSESL